MTNSATVTRALQAVELPTWIPLVSGIPDKPQPGVGYLVSGWMIYPETQETFNYNKYSKAWHRAHGPARTVTGRVVKIRRLDPDTGNLEARDIPVDGWRGQWLVRALVQAGIA